jgi:xanthine dehydrogenase small subunit
MRHPTLQFVHCGEIVRLNNVPPTRTLLQVLREDLALSATKEGCNEGDCGACTVVLAERLGGTLKYSAVNSCIRLAQSIQGMALWTAKDLSATDGTPHPVQQALLNQHASQCGFCTPGFAMSLFGLYQNKVCHGQSVSREVAQEVLSGNLCRCTGYRPILDAAQQMGQLPIVRLDEEKLLSQLELLAQSNKALEPDLSYEKPTELSHLLALRAAHPEAQLVAGCTDVGLWVNKLHMDFVKVIDVTGVRELRVMTSEDKFTQIGAAVTLTDAFAALVSQRPELENFASRFAGMPVRNSGTLGGNVANGSPIGDSMPLLIALNASVVLASLRGQREIPLDTFYTGYRKNVMLPDEVLTSIRIPNPQPGEFLRAYIVSKRLEDDISAVCLVVCLTLENCQVTKASIGAGGVAATPVRAIKTQTVLADQAWTQATVTQAMQVLRAEFSPISDMRASSSYRSQVLGNLLQRFWLESQGKTDISLTNLSLKGLSV